MRRRARAPTGSPRGPQTRTAWPTSVTTSFRPSGPLARFDSGVQALLGQVLRVEGPQARVRHSIGRRAPSARSVASDASTRPSCCRSSFPLALFLDRCDDDGVGSSIGATSPGARTRSATTAARSSSRERFSMLWSIGLDRTSPIVLAASLARRPRRSSPSVDVESAWSVCCRRARPVSRGDRRHRRRARPRSRSREARHALLILLVIWVVGSAMLAAVWPRRSCPRSFPLPDARRVRDRNAGSSHATENSAGTTRRTPASNGSQAGRRSPSMASTVRGSAPDQL